MAGDDYTAAGGGGLRLKGAKVKKHKKKSKDKSAAADKVAELDKALSSGDAAAAAADNNEAAKALAVGSAGRESRREDGDEEEEDEDGAQPVQYKTEAQRRFEEAKRKKLLEMAQSAAARPELLKTHKERVEQLNTYLSKLSEHHDMPKIGPG
ncbi:hypothetical protein RB595_007487 [Gaeumannomyces hyphopodioides]